jgi:hypothetical protein
VTDAPNVEIHYSRFRGAIDASTALGIAAVVVIGVVVGSRSEITTTSALLAVAAAICAAAFGVRALYRVFDKSAVVQLDAQGIVDHRAFDAPVAWTGIEAASCSLDCDGYEKVYLWPRATEPANENSEPICIDLGDLDSTASEVTQRIQGFAPHIALRA